MDPQHCMLCWSWVMADIQSANCKSRIATAASTRNVVLRTISLNSRVIRRLSQEMECVADPIVTAIIPLKLCPTAGYFERVLTYSCKGMPKKSRTLPDGTKPHLFKMDRPVNRQG